MFSCCITLAAYTSYTLCNIYIGLWEMCCVCESDVWACHIPVGLGKQPEFHEQRMRPAFMSFQWRVYKISCQLVAEPSSSTHFSRSPNTAVLLSYLGQGVKTLCRLWYWNPWGSTYFGGFVSFSTALNYLVWQLRTLKYLEWVLLSDYSESLMNQLEFCLVEILSELQETAAGSSAYISGTPASDPGFQGLLVDH